MYSIVKEQVADTFFSKQGHVILAGDAAHVHAVNGCKGLNNGIADAFALAWRLSLALRGHTGVLHSYEEERQEAAVKAINIAAQLARTTIRTAKEYIESIEINESLFTGLIFNPL